MSRRVRMLVGRLLAGVVFLGACGDQGRATGTISAASATTANATSTTAQPVANDNPTTTTAAQSTANESGTTSAPTTSQAPAQTTTTDLVTTAPTPTTVEEASTTVAETTTVPPPFAPPRPPPASLAPVNVVPLPQPVNPPPPRATEDHIQVGSIEIQKIGIARPMLEGVSLNTLDKGPGHWPGTAMPGRPGNVVVAGHRTSKDRPFRHIDQLVPGDEVIFNTEDGRFVYLVTGTEIVKPDAMWIVGQTPSSTATLFACHPVGSTRERIVVFLQLQV